MSYVVFARKWRPQTFDEIIGQEHITTTLKNAIKQDRVAHAYLFCGPRGIGKTTTARILAKALSCEKGPTPAPCNKCTSCLEITEGRNVDVIEIDGASNRGIDEIRDLKDKIRFSPQQGKFKVYIIDEVHMLTPEAFNALLKTLEEPPPHIKFIFATTAPYKVIPTILSRCQRFNFRRLSGQDVARKLQKIAEKEKITIEEQAVFTIVRAASGSMRDAESLLDQLATYCRNKITAEDANMVLGAIEQNRLYEFCRYVIDKDTSSAIKLINRIMDEGADPNQFILNLIEYFRSAMLIKESKDLTPLLDIPKEDIEKISKQTELLTTEDILYILYSLINANYAVRRASSPKITLELLAVKLSQKESIVSLGEIMHRLTALEKDAAPVIKKTDAPLRVEAAPKANVAVGSGLGAVGDKPSVGAKPGDKAILASEDSSAQSPEAEAMFYRIREVMPQAIKNIKQEKIYISSCLNESKLVGFNNNILTIGFSKSHNFHKENLEKAQNKKLIEDHIFKVLNSRVRIEFVTIKEDANSPSADGTIKDETETKSPLKKALSDPIIKSALDIFDGNIMKFM